MIAREEKMFLIQTGNDTSEFPIGACICCDAEIPQERWQDRFRILCDRCFKSLWAKLGEDER